MYCKHYSQDGETNSINSTIVAEPQIGCVVVNAWSGVIVEVSSDTVNIYNITTTTSTACTYSSCCSGNYTCNDAPFPGID